MKFIFLLIFSVLYLSTPSAAQSIKPNFKLSDLFADHMVLQQKQKVAFWGNAGPGQRVTITSNWGETKTSNANVSGHWKAKLETPKAGGPYSIIIKTPDTSVIIKDVLIGEVWLASGQSNMDIPLKGWPPGDTILNSKKEIENANFPGIRFFQVPFRISVTPSDAVKGKWKTVSPETAGGLSATAYFYARALHDKLHIPIGILQSSIGGTPAESWTSEAYLKQLGDFNEVIDGLQTIQAATENWLKLWPTIPIPKTNNEWKNISFNDSSAADPTFDDSSWKTAEIPGRLDLLNQSEIDGAVWIRKNFLIDDTTNDYEITTGSVDDMASVYLNGKYVGGLGMVFGNSANKITVPAKIMNKGLNVIAIRVIDTGGPGFIAGNITLSNINKSSISLTGKWKVRVVSEILDSNIYNYGLRSDLMERPDMRRINSNSPTVLFNAMIQPLAPYTIKGVIWYQGESNVGRAEQYKKLFPLMIEDWRTQWGKELPFYYVQIAPFLYSAADQKEQSQKLRDAQRYALKLPKTGMVTTLDIGYLKTAHPPYKQEVGKRLATFALKNEYGEKMLVASGPLYKKTIPESRK